MGNVVSDSRMVFSIPISTSDSLDVVFINNTSTSTST